MDRLIRTITKDGSLMAIAADSSDIALVAHQVHHTSPVASAALGRLLTGAALMGALLKGPGSSVTVKMNGGGPLGSVVAIGDGRGHVRGYVQNPGTQLPVRGDGKLDVGGGIGKNGLMAVIRDFGEGEPYIGQARLVSGEVAEDITSYYATSEQIPTACALGVLVDRDRSVKVAGGYLLQLLPGAPEDIIDRLEAGIRKAGAVTPMLEAGLTPEDILGQVCGDLGVVFMDTTEVEYRCYCSRDRVEQALISLGRKELSEIRDEGKTFPVECQFCDHVYEFTPEDIQNLLDKL